MTIVTLRMVHMIYHPEFGTRVLHKHVIGYYAALTRGAELTVLPDGTAICRVRFYGGTRNDHFGYILFKDELPLDEEG
jgi:hypothetical protein